MNYSTFYSDLFSEVYLHKAALPFFPWNRVKEFLPRVSVKIISSKEEIPEEHQNAETIFVTSSQGKVVSRCPGSRNHVCCNFLTVDLYSGCTLGCTYCIMRSYLNFAPITVFADTSTGINRLKEIALENPDRIIRAGTGEVGDSLLLDPLFDFSRKYLEELAGIPNIQFEMKTKTNFVDHLLDIKDKGNGVIGFSVNPQEIIDREEGTASSLAERLKSAEKVINSGFKVSFHFDPIFYSSTWEEQYAPVAAMLRELPAEKIAWISLGTLRYPGNLRGHLTKRPYLYDEFVKCNDGKYRYIQKVRTQIYRKMREMIGTDNGIPVYMCMESPGVWRNVYGSLPMGCKDVQEIFARPRKI